MRKAARLFEIIQVLRLSKAPVTAAAIAETLEVSQRTVYRDIVALQAMRVPIEGDRGIGYIMRPGFDLPPLMFSIEEIEAIVLALGLLERTRRRRVEGGGQTRRHQDRRRRAAAPTPSARHEGAARLGNGRAIAARPRSLARAPRHSR